MRNIIKKILRETEDDGFDWIRELPIFLPVTTDNVYVGMKVRIREDSKYYRDGFILTNPRGVIGVISEIDPDDEEYPIIVKWGNTSVNSYHHYDLEYLHEG